MAPANFSELIMIKYFIKYYLFQNFTVSNILFLIKLYINKNQIKINFENIFHISLTLKLFRILI